MSGKQFHYTIQLSENRFIDNDGALICRNAVLGKAGTQAYRASELGYDSDDIVMVHRTEDEVFDETSLSSLQGKTLTIYHPQDDVHVTNMQDTFKGFVMNVRRQGNLMIGDIKIINQEAIDLVKNNQMVELSLGYDTKLVKDSEGRIKQTNIIYNHVALVPKGRAEVARIIDQLTQEMGTVAIRDKMFEETEEKTLGNETMLSKILSAIGLKKVEGSDDTWSLSDTASALSDTSEENVEETETTDTEPEQEKVKVEDTNPEVDEGENKTKTEDAVYRTKETHTRESTYDDETGNETETSTSTRVRTVEGETNKTYHDGQPKDDEKVTKNKDEKTEEGENTNMSVFDKLIAQAKEIESIQDADLKKKLQDALLQDLQPKPEETPAPQERSALADYGNITLEDAGITEKYDFNEEIQKFYDSLDPHAYEKREDYLKYRRVMDKEVSKDNLAKEMYKVFTGGAK